MRNLLERVIPKSFLWRLSIVNIVVISSAILLTTWAVYETACLLVDGIGNFSLIGQQQFNTTLLRYFFIFTGIAVFLSSLTHFYVTKKLISPINQLIDATKKLKKGTYPAPIPNRSNDEIGQLVTHYNDLLKELQKNETKRKKLIDDVSHELRTPIANLSGYLHALKSGHIEGDEKLFSALSDQTDRLTKMVEQIERLNEWNTEALPQYGTKEKVQMGNIISQSVKIFSWQAKQAGLQINTNVEQAEIFIHKEGIEQVIMILLDNAIRYHEGDQPITLAGKVDNNSYVVSVVSAGEQINEEDQHHIFDRFYRVEHSRSRDTGGSGLGLAIAKEIIESHDGKIKLRSVDRMNNFTFALPFDK